jgi:predicted MPP superfamily phosphohydrolase
MWLANNSGPFHLEEIGVHIPGFPSLSILHISDIHFAPNQHRKAAFLRDLAGAKPDLVVNTGDNLGHTRSIGPLLNALEPLLEFRGAFVHGSNDYFAPKLKNPASYLLRPSSPSSKLKEINTERLTSEFEGAGWLNLNNASGSILFAEQDLRLAGLDDPHIGRQDPGGAGEIPVDIALVHAPYSQALNDLSSLAPKIIFAGHTHGGQVCLPNGRALVTNCDLPTVQAKGLSSFGNSLLHVSGGIGCSIYAPIRLFCPPAATLLYVN